MAAAAAPAPPPHRFIAPAVAPSSSGLIICFHGSGEESCSPAWDALADELGKSHRVLLFARGGGRPTPEASFRHLVEYLDTFGLAGPYVLIAHSHGGLFARYMLHRAPSSVAGMVLVETGQETALDAKMEERQRRRQVLGRKPLSVIRGNSFIAQWKRLEANEEATRRPDPTQRGLLEAWDAEDERLKRAQLALSSNHRYVEVRDCGHHVIRDRPDVVAMETGWVMGQVAQRTTPTTTSRLAQVVQTIRARLASRR
jgi:pimeloyl-ACP methyl ester carboxylesterase